MRIRALGGTNRTITASDDHGIGRSRGGWTTKTHALVDGRGLPLVVVVSPGQAGDSPALPKHWQSSRSVAKDRVGRAPP